MPPPQSMFLIFGGGTGFSYFPIKEFLVNPRNINWYVLDSNKELYSVGKNYVDQRSNRGLEDRIEFLKEWPSLNIDIIHSASTIEYIEKDEDLIKNLLDKYHPKIFILTRIKGGNTVEFVTRQLIGEHSTPCRFSNIQRLLDFFEKCGYMNLITSPSGKYESSQFSGDIPKEMQIHRGVDLIFQRVGT
jgi:putative methyltransferase (TIGR04325 family)